jgi:hypothetical protein
MRVIHSLCIIIYFKNQKNLVCEVISSDGNPSIAQLDLLQDAGGTLFSFEIGKPRYDLTAMHSTAAV